MSALWVCGNSFTVQDNDWNTWIKQVTDRNNYNPAYLSIGNSSLDYIYQTFNEFRPYVEEGDVIILAITDTNRRWFIRSEPDNAVFRSVTREDEVGEAMNAYLQHLDNLTVFETYLENFLHNLNNFSRKKKVHTILIPCFEHVDEIINNPQYKKRFESLHIADGNLMVLSRNEFEPGEFLASGILRTVYDPRANHLIRSNHDIMANKLQENIENKTPITLKKGFKENILNRTIMDQAEFGAEEQFGNTLVEIQKVVLNIYT